MKGPLVSGNHKNAEFLFSGQVSGFRNVVSRNSCNNLFCDFCCKLHHDLQILTPDLPWSVSIDSFLDRTSVFAVLKSTTYIAAVFHSEINNEEMDIPVRNDSSSRGNIKKPKAKSKWKKREARIHNVTQEEEMDELKNRIIDVSSLAHDHMVYFINFTPRFCTIIHFEHLDKLYIYIYTK